MAACRRSRAAATTCSRSRSRRPAPPRPSRLPPRRSRPRRRRRRSRLPPRRRRRRRAGSGPSQPAMAPAVEPRPAPRRPRSVMLVAGLHVLEGLVALLLGGILGGLGGIALLNLPGPADPELVETAIFGGVLFLLGPLLLATAVGLLRLHSWAWLT